MSGGGGGLPRSVSMTDMSGAENDPKVIAVATQSLQHPETQLSTNDLVALSGLPRAKVAYDQVSKLDYRRGHLPSLPAHGGRSSAGSAGRSRSCSKLGLT